MGGLLDWLYPLAGRLQARTDKSDILLPELHSALRDFFDLLVIIKMTPVFLIMMYLPQQIDSMSRMNYYLPLVRDLYSP
jgi:hypothetical protein